MNDFKSIYTDICKALKEQRLRLELTQEYVAQRTELTRTSLANIEAGRQNPPLHIIYQLCTVLDLEPKDILPPMKALKTKVLDLSSNQTVELPPLAAEMLDKLLKEVEE